MIREGTRGAGRDPAPALRSEVADGSMQSAMPPSGAGRLELVHAQLCEQLDKVAHKWREIRQGFDGLDGDMDTHDWAKGNARWAGGLAAEVTAFDIAAFSSVGELCEGVARFARERPWDGDYDEPADARKDVLVAVEGVRGESS
ncbi:MAG TPA: hypothetical protein VMN39_02450 [Longimicrobiaceae bacterium]|nr:hypothetical protein [Longimicrobiaceae bacterium]